MPGCIVSATTASFRSVEKRRRRATPVMTSTFENVSDIGVCLGLYLGPPAKAGVRSKRGAVQPLLRCHGSKNVNILTAEMTEHLTEQGPCLSGTHLLEKVQYRCQTRFQYRRGNNAKRCFGTSNINIL